jgi:hypothetical protein
LSYFAEPGIALDGNAEPTGYLIPQDARPANSATFLALSDVQRGLSTRPWRHLLAILDCNFAGAFRWASADTVNPPERTSERLGSIALQLQGVSGDAAKAEASFFRITQQAAPIDKIEIEITLVHAVARGRAFFILELYCGRDKPWVRRVSLLLC